LQKWVGFIEKNLLLKNKLARMAQIYKKNSWYGAHFTLVQIVVPWGWEEPQ
jgi:hypothetical protein